MSETPQPQNLEPSEVAVTVEGAQELTAELLQLGGAIVIPVASLPPGSQVSIVIVVGPPVAEPEPQPAPAPQRRHIGSARLP